MEQKKLVTFQPETDSVSLDQACILVDRNDFEGVRIAASLLSQDFEMVTGSRLDLVQYQGNLTALDTERLGEKTCIIVGSIHSSRLIQSLIHEKKLTVNDIQGCWESFVMAVIDQPMQSVSKALIIAGSDKRGTVYGIYTVSEQIGVSP